MNAFVEPRAPAYPWGLCVVVLDDLFNDGSYPNREPQALLAARGAVGQIVNIGHATEMNEPVYLVEFGPEHGGCVVGCMEDEIVPAPAGLLPVTDEAA